MTNKNLLEVSYRKSEKGELGGSLNSVLFQDICLTALEYRSILEELEWSVIANFGNDLRCPCCKNLKNEGHKHECRLRIALSK
ncbi:hypothetical protein [Clostridium sp.]|uniref:hypothetical protein n=1 Tax=Clostridium sp. TaxID=1506 RepID=UPI002FCBB29F